MNRAVRPHRILWITVSSKHIWGNPLPNQSLVVLSPSLLPFLLFFFLFCFYLRVTWLCSSLYQLRPNLQSLFIHFLLHFPFLSFPCSPSFPKCISFWDWRSSLLEMCLHPCLACRESSCSDTEFDWCCCADPTSPFKLTLQTWSFSVFCFTQQPSCDVDLSTNAHHILRKEQMFLPSVAKYSLRELGLTRSPTLTSCITAVLAELVGVLAEWQMDTSGSSKLWSCR